MKNFYEAIKAGLDKADDDVFKAEVSQNMVAREAKNLNKLHALMGNLNQRVSGGDTYTASKNEAKQLFQAFVKLSEQQCNDIFNHLTKKPEPKKDKKKENQSPSNARGTPTGRGGGLNVNRLRQEEEGSGLSPPITPENVRLDLAALQNKFESFCKNQESMVSILNVKLIKQRFADF